MNNSNRKSPVDIVNSDDYYTKASILLTVQEICELLKVSKPYIYWLTHQKKIPFIKMHGHLRFRQSEIDDWLKEQEFRIGNSQEKK
ncbi:helix-turn-helix domain-containing protein [Candidatus Poribacteria bacterium]|nr:helix-turn-helix domain-containing protein [Candidatus Poribacteria bacterium]